MSSLARTIDRTLAAIGHGPREFLLETLAGFARLGLEDEERASAIAMAVASSAVSHYTFQRREFVEAVAIWALDAAAVMSAPVPRIAGEPNEDRVMEGADLLIGGIVELQRALLLNAASMSDRLAAELTLYTRLLAAHDPHTVLSVLSGVTEALSTGSYRAGDLIQISLRDPLPVDRTADLADMPMQGRA